MDTMPRPEVGLLHDWAWLQFSPHAHVHFDPQGDGTFELVIYVGYAPARLSYRFNSRFAVQDTDAYKVSVYNVPGANAYATADLFEPHPFKEGLWRMYVTEKLLFDMTIDCWSIEWHGRMTS